MTCPTWLRPSNSAFRARFNAESAIPFSAAYSLPVSPPRAEASLVISPSRCVMGAVCWPKAVRPPRAPRPMVSTAVEGTMMVEPAASRAGASASHHLVASAPVDPIILWCPRSRTLRFALASPSPSRGQVSASDNWSLCPLDPLTFTRQRKRIEIVSRLAFG